MTRKEKLQLIGVAASLSTKVITYITIKKAVEKRIAQQAK